MRQLFLDFRRSVSAILVLLLILFSSSTLLAQNGDPVAGKTLFNSNCAACHKLDKKMVGPPLAGIADKREREWLYKWIKNSAALIKTGDAEAVQIYEEYNKTPMTAFPQLSTTDIDNILAYTSAPPAKKIAITTDITNDSPSKQTDNSRTKLMLLFVAIVLFILALALLVINKKLRQLAEVNGLESPKAKKDSLFKSYLKNQFLTLITAILLFLVAIYFIYAYLMQIGIDQGYKPIQPIHFSHKIHAGDNKIDCKYCHSNARVSKNSGVPALNICMNCHKNIYEYNGEIDPKKEYTKEFYDGEIQKLYKAVGWDSDNGVYTGETSPVKWVRIHNLPDFVYFNHSQHVSVAGVQCQKCHGPVETMEIMYQHTSLTMGWCINCHRETNVNIKDNAYYEKIHKQLAEKYGVNKFTEAQMGGLECGKCHY